VADRQKGRQHMDFDWSTWMLIIGGILLVVLIVVFFVLRSRRPEE
jgi:hypothetical protein